MKEARALHAAGAVEEARYANGVLEGLVAIQGKMRKVRVEIRTRTWWDNHCSCPIAKRDGAVCAHALAVAEAYVATMEALRGVPGVALAGFDVEQNATWPTGRGPKDLLRPDALVVLTREEVSDVWWLEVDRDTESLPRIVRLLRRYLAFARSGQAGPRGVVPRMLLSVPSPDRLAGVQTEIARLPAPAAQLFAVCMESEVAALLVSEILDDGSPVREA